MNESLGKSKEDCLKHLEIITKKMYILLQLECKIRINIVDDLKENSYIASNALAMVVRDKKSYQIYIKKDLIELDSISKQDLICGTLYHEFLHIYDREKVYKNQYFKLNFFEKYKNLEMYLIFLGFNFWTEYFAYEKTFIHFHQYFKGPTFYSLIKFYKSLKEESYEIQLYFGKSKEIRKKLNNFKKRVDFFVYNISMYMAYENQQKKYKYSEKIMNLEETKEVNKILTKTKPYLVKMNHGTYGKYLTTRLFNLGRLIVKNIYNPLHLEIVRHRKKICVAFYK